VWYTLSNRVPILRTPSADAPVVGTVPTPAAICAVRSVGRFLEVRYYTSAGRAISGFVERFRVDSRPMDGSAMRRTEEVCTPPRRIAAAAPPAAAFDAPTRAPAVDTSAQRRRSTAQLSPQVRARIEEQTRLLAFAQEWYFNKQGEYASTLASLSQVFATGPGVTITIREADAQSWSAQIEFGGTTCTLIHSVSTGSVTECR